MHSPCHCHSQRRAEKDKKKQKKEASLIAVGVGAAAAAVQKKRTLVDNDDPAAWLIAAGVILPTKVDDEQSTVQKQSPIHDSTVEKQSTLDQQKRTPDAGRSQIMPTNSRKTTRPFLFKQKTKVKHKTKKQITKFLTHTTGDSRRQQKGISLEMPASSASLRACGQNMQK